MTDYINTQRQFGLANEQPVIDRLQTYFNEIITKTEERYCLYDGYSENCKYEIKTRRNKYSTYPTTLVGINKLKVKGNLRFVFSFTDGLYYIDYDEELFNTFDVKETIYSKNGTLLRNVAHIFIPIQLLVLIP